MRRHFPLMLTVIAPVAVIVLFMSVFTVDQRERAILLQLGDPVGDIQQPGLHFKIPLIQTVRRFDARILSVDPPPSQMVISSGRDNPVATAAQDMATDDDTPDLVSGEPIVVDTFGRYRITNPLKFMMALGSVETATMRIDNIMNDATRAVLRGSTMRQLLSPNRSILMERIRKIANDKAQTDNLGIEILDIRIVRADLTEQLRESTVKRMISELQERATETRAKGDQNAQKIRATADKERTIVLAQADRDAAAIEGDGDKQAIAIYASAYNRDKDFYAFLRSLDAYKRSMTGTDTRLILSPDNAFLKYFKEGPEALK